MKILITGATGFVGRPLCKKLLCEGHQLTLLVRRATSIPDDWNLPTATLEWDPSKSDCPYSLDAYDAVVHLLGESVADGRWTPARRELIKRSRGLATRRLAAALNKRPNRLPCFISASAIGFYPFDDQKEMTESSAPGSHFLAQVCQEWEAAAAEVLAERRVILRIGTVLGPNGGALQRLRPIFAAGIGGRLGDGKQIMSWIHRDDLVEIISSAIQNHDWQGTYNAVSPQPASNLEFTRTLAQVLHRPAVFPLPSAVLKLALGEMSMILLGSQRVKPERLLQRGFAFRFPQLSAALADVCTLQSLETAQFLAQPLSEIFAFFADPNNLERITPEGMHFKITSMSTAGIQAGTIINYRLSLHGVPFRWRTLIAEWQPGQHFIDTQQKGPFAVWNHLHRFHAVQGGTLMIDRVQYKVPLGWLGECVALPFVRNEVKHIFKHRRRVIAAMFPQKPG